MSSTYYTGGNTYATVTTGTSTSANHWIYTNTIAQTGQYFAVQQYVPTPQISEYDVEQALQMRLLKQKQMLLQWKKVRFPHRWSLLRETGPHELIEHPLAAHEADGYILEKDKVYVLPDGAVLKIDSHGNYGIYDEEVKVIYRANRNREFNPFINASDLLEKFIASMHAQYKVSAVEVLELSVNVFIHWLVLEAAKKDGDITDNLPQLESVLPPRLLQHEACGS